MRFRIVFGFALAVALTTVAGWAENPTVTLETSMGNIVVELFSEKSPKTVENFLAYVKSGHYDGTIFHRVIPGFMIQGGGFDSEMKQRSTREPIQNESKNGVKNARGTISMARTRDPHSATGQFFINTVDNTGLDAANLPDGWGYAVFGEVTDGMDVVDAISGVKTTSRGGHQNVPVDVVVLKKATAN